MKVGWKIGDFGRFSAESPKLPRFEVISADRNGITVWYSGSPTTTTIPLTTFKKDCVNWWHVTGVDLATPAWLQPKVLFKFQPVPRYRPLSEGYDTVLTAHMRNQYIVMSQSVDVRGAVLQYRHRRADYISCQRYDNSKELLLIPLKEVINHGFRVTTAWDRLDEVLETDDEYIDFTGLI